MGRGRTPGARVVMAGTDRLLTGPAAAMGAIIGAIMGASMGAIMGPAMAAGAIVGAIMGAAMGASMGAIMGAGTDSADTAPALEEGAMAAMGAMLGAIMGAIMGASMGAAMGAGTDSADTAPADEGAMAAMGAMLGAIMGAIMGAAIIMGAGAGAAAATDSAETVGAAAGAIMGAAMGAMLGAIIGAIMGAIMGAIGAWTEGLQSKVTISGCGIVKTLPDTLPAHSQWRRLGWKGSFSVRCRTNSRESAGWRDLHRVGGQGGGFLARGGAVGHEGGLGQGCSSRDWRGRGCKRLHQDPSMPIASCCGAACTETDGLRQSVSLLDTGLPVIFCGITCSPPRSVLARGGWEACVEPVSGIHHIN